MQRVQLGQALFERGDVTIPLLQQSGLFRQLREAAVACGEVLFEPVDGLPVMGLLFAELDFEPVQTALRRFQFLELRPEPFEFLMLAVRFNQPLLQIDKLLLFAGKLLLHLGASSVGLTDFIGERRHRCLLIGESLQLCLRLRSRRLTARLTFLEVLLQRSIRSCREARSSCADRPRLSSEATLDSSTMTAEVFILSS